MLRDHPIHAAIPANDLERARAFYADKLGLTPTPEDPAGLSYETPDGAWIPALQDAVRRHRTAHNRWVGG
jgi:catechol 2,3-dioxygenase-like lactoylglutathione lyase family enzyme